MHHMDPQWQLRFFFSSYDIQIYDVTGKSNEFSLYTVCSRWSLIKHISLSQTGLVCFSLSPRVIDIRQASGFVFFILFRALWRGVPMDADEPLLLDTFQKKSSHELRKEEGDSRRPRIQARFVCTGALRVSRGPSLRIFNQRKFEYEIRAVFVWRFLCVRMKTVTTRRLETLERVRLQKSRYSRRHWIIPSVRYNTEKRRKITAPWLDANFFKPSERYVSFVLHRLEVLAGFWMEKTGEKLIKLQCAQIRRKYKLPCERVEKRYLNLVI